MNVVVVVIKMGVSMGGFVESIFSSAIEGGGPWTWIR